jgi:hypothetical protein
MGQIINPTIKKTITILLRLHETGKFDVNVSQLIAEHLARVFIHQRDILAEVVGIIRIQLEIEEKHSVNWSQFVVPITTVSLLIDGTGRIV